MRTRWPWSSPPPPAARLQITALAHPASLPPHLLKAQLRGAAVRALHWLAVLPADLLSIRREGEHHLRLVGWLGCGWVCYGAAALSRVEQG